MNYFWLSFVDEDKPKGQRFLGVAILRAKNTIEAIKKAHRLKINPGGEVQSVVVPNDWEKIKILKKMKINCLIKKNCQI